MGTLRFIIAWKTKKNAKPAKSNIQRNLSGISRQFVRSNTLFQYSIPILYSSILFRYSIPVRALLKTQRQPFRSQEYREQTVQDTGIQAASADILWFTLR